MPEERAHTVRSHSHKMLENVNIYRTKSRSGTAVTVGGRKEGIARQHGETFESEGIV